MKNTVLLSITNCLDCPNHHRFNDPGSADSFDASDESVKCKLTGKFVMACDRWDIRKQCAVPDWCPLPKVGVRK